MEEKITELCIHFWNNMNMCNAGKLPICAKMVSMYVQVYALIYISMCGCTYASHLKCINRYAAWYLCWQSP
jgi:hypothetical protein